MQAESLGDAVPSEVSIRYKGRKLQGRKPTGTPHAHVTSCPGEFSSQQFGACMNFFFVRLRLVCAVVLLIPEDEVLADQNPRNAGGTTTSSLATHIQTLARQKRCSRHPPGVAVVILESDQRALTAHTSNIACRGLNSCDPKR